MINFENIIKSLFTTVLGCVMMGFAFYGWYMDTLTDWQAGGCGTVGFALLFMRDQIPAFISKFLNKKIDNEQK